MNKKLIAVLCAVLAVAVACCIAVAGCKKKAAEGQVTVTVTYASTVEGVEFDGKTTTVVVDEGATVYDALVATGWPIDAEDSQWGKYIHGIDGHGDGSNIGWVYTENQEMAMDGADAHTVIDGATYDWTLISW